MLGPLDAAAIASLVDAAGPQSGSSLLVAELRQLGGALGRPPQDAGALAALDEPNYSLRSTRRRPNPTSRPTARTVPAIPAVRSASEPPRAAASSAI